MKKTKKIFLIIVGIFLLLIGMFLGNAFLKSRECVKFVNCFGNLKTISVALHNYASDNNRALPDRLSCLYPNYVSSLKVFICPSTRDKISSSDEIDKNTSYIYVKGLTEDNADGKLVIYDKRYNHTKGHHSNCRNEAFLDGRVKSKNFR